MLERLSQALAGRYLIERHIGQGGMASVWLARDLRLGRAVAIKVLNPELAGAIGAERFVREIHLTARLEHPSIVPVLDSGIVDGPGGIVLPWYSMVYVPGESLRARLAREGSLPVEEALRLTREAAAALATAHRAGIVHRDIKPENLLVAGGHLYIVDFGIAKALLDTGGERLTSTGFAIGTPAYMSPEQASAEPVDARTDQYSLACVLYEMLVGEPPFAGPTAQAIVARRMTEPARAIRPVRPTVPEAVEAAVLKALERIPADRHRDLDSFVAALGGGESPDRPVRSPGTRHWWYAGAGLVAIALAAVALSLRARSPAAAPPGHMMDSATTVLYRRGVRAYELRTTEGIAEAVATFSAALSRDSNAVPVWLALARTYARAYERPFPIAGIRRDSVLHLAVRASDRARAIDPSSAEAWVTTAMVSRSVDPTDLSAPLRAIRQALALDSTNPEAWGFLAIVRLESGDADAGLQAWRREVAVAPAYTQGLAFLALGHYWRRQYDSAAYWADSTLRVEPTYVLGRTTSGYIALEQGRFTRARAQFEAAARLTTDLEWISALASEALVDARQGSADQARVILKQVDSLARLYQPAPLHLAVYLAQAYAALRQNDKAVGWLRRFPTPASVHFQLHLRCDPPFDPIADDPRFRALLLAPRPPAPQGC